MKKYILLIAAVLIASMPMTAGRMIETRGDTLLIARDGDTVRLNGTQTIKDNNFDGHFCIHFYGSKTHGTKKVDEMHQNCVAEAMKHTW